MPRASFAKVVRNRREDFHPNDADTGEKGGRKESFDEGRRPWEQSAEVVAVAPKKKAAKKKAPRL